MHPRFGRIMGLVANRVVFDRNIIFLFRPITIFGKNCISDNNIGRNAKYWLFRPVLYRPLLGKTGNSADNIGRHRISVEHYNRDIAEGEEVTVDYNYGDGDSDGVPAWYREAEKGAC